LKASSFTTTTISPGLCSWEIPFAPSTAVISDVRIQFYNRPGNQHKNLAHYTIITTAVPQDNNVGVGRLGKYNCIKNRKYNYAVQKYKEKGLPKTNGQRLI
jgi:hypothetical protein